MPKYWQLSPHGDAFREERPLCVPKGAKPVYVIPAADWERLVAYCNTWMTAHHCEGHCAECDEDDAVRAIIEKVRANNG